MFKKGMKSIFLVAFLVAAVSIMNIACKKASDVPPPTANDSFNVSVTNGYGSGKFRKGDTVHIFSEGLGTTKLFDSWSGSDVNLLKGAGEWHTWFVMPDKNVSFTGAISNFPLSSLFLNLASIRGKNINKPVYYYFPSAHKGMVFLFHGSGGTASNVVNSYEFQLLIKTLVTDGFGVVITESEESTLNMDLNGDGKIRWSPAPADSVGNVDYANIKAITDSIYARGWSSRSIPRYTIGMSNGGAFSATVSAYFKYKAGVSYCSQTGAAFASLSTTPLQFCMARYDHNDNVGSTGNAEALSNSQALTSRGICSKFLMNERSPLYAERFARTGELTIARSRAIFNELKLNNFLDNRNYYKGYSDALVSAYLATPANFPQLGSITAAQRLMVLSEIDLAVSDHQMYSDYNKATLKFLNTQCL